MVYLIIIVIPNNIQLVPKIFAVGLKHLYYYSFIYSAYYIISSYRLFTVYFNSYRIGTRLSVLKEETGEYRDSNYSLPVLRGEESQEVLSGKYLDYRIKRDQARNILVGRDN